MWTTFETASFGSWLEVLIWYSVRFFDVFIVTRSGTLFLDFYGCWAGGQLSPPPATERTRHVSDANWMLIHAFQTFFSHFVSLLAYCQADVTQAFDVRKLGCMKTGRLSLSRRFSDVFGIVNLCLSYVPFMAKIFWICGRHDAVCPKYVRRRQTESLNGSLWRLYVKN